MPAVSFLRNRSADAEACQRSNMALAVALYAAVYGCAAHAQVSDALPPPATSAAAAPAEPAPPPPESAAGSSDVRAQTRLFRRGSTAVTEAQASELTLTLTEAAFRPIQTWVRTAGTLDQTGRILTTRLRSPEADSVQVGQRLRCFSVTSRTQMHQARVTRVTPEPGGAVVEATIAVAARNDGARYLMEIVVERGPYLSVPNVSIIEEGGSRVVYVQEATGEYTPRTIQTGLEGELYTQVTDGLAEGDHVVSIGSFFIDADNKLKSGE
jgi:hypothetical protein